MFLELDQTQMHVARLVAGVLADPRPAWLWLEPGDAPLWQNWAAQGFKRKLKRKAGTDIAPIGRQIARAIRLGVVGRSSLSRMQFTIGKKPISLTCTCTPLQLEDGRSALLVVGVDPLDQDSSAHDGLVPADLSALPGLDDLQVVVDAEGKVLTGSEASLKVYRARQAAGGLADAPRLDAGRGFEVIVLPGEETEEPAQQSPTAFEADSAREASEERKRAELSQLFDKLAGQETLFSPLGANDDAPEEQADAAAPLTENAHSSESGGSAEPEPRENSDPASGTTETPTLWRLVGRGFVPRDAVDANAPAQDAPLDGAEAHEDDGEALARSNFDEISRILTDQMALPDTKESAEPDEDNAPEDDGTVTQGGSGVVSLGDEPLILNRLPIGLLVFRDQQILFANRALTELTGYSDTQSLRDAGLDAIFPEAGESDTATGPVTHLTRADGAPVPVSARLQSIVWRGRTALLLSAQRREEPPQAETLVRNFAETMASVEEAGFIEASRAGIVTAASGRAADLYERSPSVLIGRPLYGLIALSEGARLRDFLEAPARFAGSARPSVRLRGAHPGLELVLFIEGSAGIATGYFGLVRRIVPSENTVAAARGQEIDPSLLARVARGIRRPLNTIVGFADLIRTEAFGPVENARYKDYAGDIKTAGQDIAGLVDEIEDYARLREEGFVPTPNDVELAGLLDACVARIRGHANAARVLVRSAISTQLPLIRADRTTLSQAVLNLLASAIDQTPEGGQVVLSANRIPNGGVEVHVRDSAHPSGALEDRFVVFREGFDADGQVRKPVHSSVGLALTRSLLAVNACSLSVDPSAGKGTLMSLVIPPDLISLPHTEPGNDDRR